MKKSYFVPHPSFHFEYISYFYILIFLFMKKNIFTTTIFLLTSSYLILHTSFSIATEKVPFTKEQTRTIDSLRQVLKTSV
ncbi:MAG: hypothetical protein WC223_12750, partial [Bacteroidales bacterium]